MAEELTFSIGEDKTVTVRSFEELDRWLAVERSNWNWLVRNDGQTDRFSVAAHIHGAWDQLIQQVATIQAQSLPLPQVAQHLGALHAGPILISTTTKGAQVLDILKNAGPLPASFSAGFLQRVHGLNSAQFGDDLLGALLTVLPDMRASVDLNEQLKRERTTYRQATRSLVERVDREADERKAEGERLVTRASLAARRIFAFRRGRWRAAQDAWQADADTRLAKNDERNSQSIATIEATDKAFREFMKLKAPVEYWNAKAQDHSMREGSARKRLYWYFPITLIILTAAFGLSGWLLLSHPDTAQSKSPVALYVVVSGGLLVLSTVAFWIGRLLTKLYLSEHHLRNDAEERATMTTTYLALTSEGAAADADRHIVLSAIFRATPDGIVKDDGPSDASVQGLLSKILVR